jgi:hypothetical protein
VTREHGVATQLGPPGERRRAESQPKTTARREVETGMGVFVVYVDNAGQYRWRLFAANNRIIAE